MNLNKYNSVAKIGYAARGVIYLTIGTLAFSSAMGWGGKQAGSKEAILTLRGQPFGEVLLAIMVVGLIAYVIWRLFQGISDTDEHGRSVKGLTIRAGLVLSAISHSTLAFWLVMLLLDNNEGSSDQSMSAKINEYLGSEVSSWVYGFVALIIVGVGLAHLFKGFTRRFNKYIDFPPNKKRGMTLVCQFGLIARGVVWCIVGWIILRSAFVAGQSDEKGIADAFNWLATTPFGSWVILIIALGLFAFGVYSFLESFYRRIEQ